MELDTGAALSLISEKDFKVRWPNTNIGSSQIKLRTYTGEQVSVLGSYHVNVVHNSQMMELPLLVVKGAGPCLLGRNWLEKIQLDWQQLNVLHSLHEGRPGMARMKSLARGFAWWPKMDAKIEGEVKACDNCQQNQPMPPKNSKWMEVFPLNNATTHSTIEKLRLAFATHGLPDKVVSDNGTPFTSAEFNEFMKKNGILHICTSPYHPSSNGLAERAVRTFKNAIVPVSNQ